MKSNILLGITLISIALIITACGADREAQLADYENRVIAVLEGDPLNDTGVGQILSITIGDLGCDGSLCTAAVRFQFLATEPQRRMALVADYRAQICKPEFKVPDFVAERHAELCALLQEVVNILDAVFLNASNGSRLASTGTGVEAILDEISNRLATDREALIETQQALQAFDYLNQIMSR